MEIHAWGSQTDDIEYPDRLVLDLDPDPSVPWRDVISAALSIRKILAAQKLTSFVKTTGGKGLHIVVPILPRHSWPEVKQFARNLADDMVNSAPGKYIATMSKSARRGKIFIDYLRNERGATSIVAYSTRAKPEATVSMPISWTELSKLKSPQQFDIRNTQERLVKMRKDPWKQLSQTH